MHILLTTFGLLLIFSAFCSTQWRMATDMAFMDIVSSETFAKCRNKTIDILNNHSKGLYKKENPEKENKPQGSKAIASKVDSTTQADTNALIERQEEDEDDEAAIELPDEFDEEPAKNPKAEKCTSVLHIGELFSDEPLDIHSGKGKACFTLLKNLITELYSGQRFFEEAKQLDPDFEQRFLENLYERAAEENENRSLTRVKDLATLDLHDNVQMYARCKIFNGNKSRFTKDSLEHSGYYPILEFTTMAKKSKLMSLWLAPKPLLMALFQNEDVVQEVLETRREIYNDLRKDKNTSSVQAKEQDLRLRFATYIPETVDYIDFKVSRTRPPDMPKTKPTKK